MKLIGFFPASYSEIQVSDMQHIISIENSGKIWKINGDEVKAQTDCLDNDLLGKTDFIITQFRSNNVILLRHHKNKPDLELKYRELAISVLNLAQALRNNKISKVIFKTLSSHHVNSLSLEIACRICDIEQIFLYQVAFINRLIPVFQTHGIESRTVSNYMISSKVFNNEIEYFDRHHLEEKSEQALFFKNEQNFIKAVIKTIARYFKTQISSFYLTNIKSLGRPVVQRILPAWSLIDILTCLFQQRNSNVFLSACVSQDQSAVEDLVSENFLIVYTHLEPESTNFPEGGTFWNVIDLILEVRRCGYTRNVLIKEHPEFRTYSSSGHSSRAGIFRSVNFYQILRNLGCVFVDRNFMVNEKGTVITLTGTIAIERSLAGRKTVVMGKIWYEGLPGTMSLEHFTQNHLNLDNLPDEKIASEARLFMAEKLNNRTLDNPYGIATGFRSPKIMELTDHNQEFKTFISILLDRN